MSPEEAQYMITLYEPNLQESNNCKACAFSRSTRRSSLSNPSKSELIAMASGVSAIEDCIEALFTMDATPESNYACTQALRLLTPSLLAMKQNPEDANARWQCQLGENFARQAQASRSCSPTSPHGTMRRRVSVSSILKFKKESSESRQELVKQLLWDEDEVADFLHGEGIEEDNVDLADTLDAILVYLQSYPSFRDSGVWTA